MKKIIGLIFASFIIASVIFSIYASADSDTEIPFDLTTSCCGISVSTFPLFDNLIIRNVDTAALREEVKKKMREKAESERQEAKRTALEIESNAGERLKKIERFRDKIRENNGWLEVGGKSIRVREMSEEKKEIIAGKINAKTGLNLTAEDIGEGKIGQVLRAFLSNGRYAIVKVMPDRAAAVALQRLRAKCEERNCSVELKEFKIKNKTIAGYEVETEKDSKLFLIFKKKIKVRAVVDAETGEIISIKKPWWAFLVKEKHEDESGLEDEDTKKVTICHIPPGNESAANTISIGRPALEAHLGHGDYEGECKSAIIIINETNNNETGNIAEDQNI